MAEHSEPQYRGSVQTVLAGLHLLHPARHAVRRLRLLARRGSGSDHRLYRRYLAANAVRKLHIGCGQHLLPGWLNTDFFPRSAAVLHLDATRPFAFPDTAFDYVFSEHMIEHVPYGAGLRMLSECWRVLRPSGRLRISTPDLAFLVALHGDDRSPVAARYIDWSCRAYLLKEPNPAFVINNFVRDWGHCFIYDERTLRAAMAAAGFTDISRCELQQSPDPALRDLEHESRLPAGFLRLETFTLEGRKPG